MFDDKDDIKLTDTKSTKLDAERSKREEQSCTHYDDCQCDWCHHQKCEIEDCMRCSELCGNIERDK
jgi:hypothetical protein